jgi:O-6-methylguanine DNA methyltransferase
MVAKPPPSPLQQQWATLFQTTLPALARIRDPVQPHWPVHLDHCFARIILDNTVGQGTQQWDRVIGRPALRNMSEQQLREAIELGEKIGTGEVDLVELDRRSLDVRGKPHKNRKGDGKSATSTTADTFKSEEGQFLSSSSSSSSSKKRKAGVVEANSTSNKKMKQATLSFASKDNGIQPPPLPSNTNPTSTIDLLSTYARIQAHPTLTPYRKRLYAALLTVPRGRYTTYAAMSEYLRSSARAVGNGMRNNPFAPEVPCHRVLAADGSVGGFHGDWGAEGKYAKDKIDLLKKEGVVFDSRGKVKGVVWRGFYELNQKDDRDGPDLKEEHNCLEAPTI